MNCYLILKPLTLSHCLVPKLEIENEMTIINPKSETCPRLRSGIQNLKLEDPNSYNNSPQKPVLMEMGSARCANVVFFRKYILKISEKPCDFIVEDTPSLKFFIIYIIFSLRSLRSPFP